MSSNSVRPAGAWDHPWVVGVAVAAMLVAASPAHSRQNIRQAFFEVYPGAVGTAIETVPSQPNHCGVCHYRFTGGGTRNPYGLTVQNALGGFPNTDQGRRDAVLSVQDFDPDGDGFTTLVEVTDLINYSNTPTFPGLAPANVGSVSNVTVSEIQDHLVPTAGGDVTPPSVSLIYPNGGESLTANQGVTVQWTATDASGVAGVNLYLSLDDGATYKLVAENLSNTGSHTWFPANRPSIEAYFRVEAIDNALNVGYDDSNNEFTILSPTGGIAPTTLRDFDMPGTQPFETAAFDPPQDCAACHGNYDQTVEPYFNWQGSMMAHASIDPIFEANMTIANQDAPDSGDLCLRCHISNGWLRGRSVPTDGSAMLASDKFGLACDMCHRMVDPISDPENPAVDAAILAALTFPGTWFGNGMLVIDPTPGTPRGPFSDATGGHSVLVSPFHREAALCGTCHDVSNPAFEKDGSGNYLPNAFDAPATDFSATKLAPVERTYSEWLNSEYNTPQGVFAPQFGGNKDYVATCQDCHMRDVTGKGATFDPQPPTRTDLPLHDMTGGSTWLPGILATLYPAQVDAAAVQAGIARARYMLQNAAELAAVQQGNSLKVTVTNNSGHKLPTGYPEGRRVWLNVQFYDEFGAIIAESGAYDVNTGVLSHDADAKIYEVEPGLDEVIAPLVGVPPGPSFHFVLNNKVFKDNRIPPRGFTNAAFAAFGGAPVDHSYADGQYWDDTSYSIPPDASTIGVTLYYQSTSKEFVEFLRDENTTNTKGQEMYDLWNNNGKCPPEVMATVRIGVLPPIPGDYDGDGDVDLGDYAALPDCMTGPGGSSTTVCEPFDFDGDGNIDLNDYAAFQFAFTG
jgi:hypothetical protein